MAEEITHVLEIKPWKIEEKSFYSAGSSFSALGCSAAVGTAWKVLGSLSPHFENIGWGLVLSFVLVYAYALVIPEPQGYRNQGQLRITMPEAIFGFFNALQVFAIVMGVRCYFSR
ncbi:MAG TPA: hypothetical protein VG206_07280 [Terriglobia bacterium]|nr:hypothetical protein [Terriglobia bacterium]